MTTDQLLLGIYLSLDAYKLVRDDAWVREQIAAIQQSAKTPEDVLDGMRALRVEAAAKAKADIEAMTK
ncbi:MAG: hypothetical protein AB1560_02040 [Pseudomonadota bacterium]